MSSSVWVCGLTAAGAQAAATRTWTERWIAREREFTRQLEEKDADFRSKVEELRREFADMLRSYASKAQEAMRDREVRDLGNLDEKLKELHRAREDLASVRAQVEEEVGSRFEEALRRERELESKARQEAEALRRREVSAVNEALRAEREQAAAARSELETAHRREMSALESAVASERRMAEENQDRFRSVRGHPLSLPQACGGRRDAACLVPCAGAHRSLRPHAGGR